MLCSFWAIKARRDINFNRPSSKLIIMSHNQVRRSSSSSSDDEQTSAFATHERQIAYEDHDNKKCKYVRYETVIQDRKVYINIRVCTCGLYHNTRGAYDVKMDLTHHDGKDVHTSDQCRWERTKIREWRKKIYRLTQYCACQPITQQRYSQTRSMNQPTHYW